MGEFFQALKTVPILQYALIAGLISSVTFGVVGSFVVVRRISYIAAAIAHSILGGIGAAIFCERRFGWEWSSPLLGAIIAALVSALVIGVVSLRARDREDTIIGAIWAAGMAIGILFVQFTPGSAVNLESYILGNILLTSKEDVTITAILATIVLGVTVLFYNKLVAVCFDEEFARLRGVNTSFYFLLLLCLVALSVVLLVRLTGIILAIALIVLPAATASRFTNRLWIMMLVATVISVCYMLAGFIISYPLQLPTGPFMVILAAGGYAVAFVAKLVKKKRR